jgi:predicted RNA binding protein YcfA (HicA-like mRNA interferase family)
MINIKPISRKELIKKLKHFGYDGPFSGGKHQFMIKDNIRLTIPNPHKSEISPDLLKRILNQAKITTKDWLEIK